MTDEKYIVFKRKDFQEFWERIGGSGAKGIDGVWENAPDPLQDATVIRGQDLFAAPALDSYANSIGVFVSLADPGDPRRDYLQSVADYFHRRADESRGIAFKTPDNGGH